MRIHAQATLLKIWQHAKDCGLREELSYSFPLLKANMEFAMLSGYEFYVPKRFGYIYRHVLVQLFQLVSC